LYNTFLETVPKVFPKGQSCAQTAFGTFFSGYNPARETLPAILDIKAQNPYTDFTDSTDLRGFF